MTGLLMSDDGLKGFTESLKILDTTLDLATLVSPLYCVKSLLIKVLLDYALHSPPCNIMNSWLHLHYTVLL